MNDNNSDRAFQSSRPAFFTFLVLAHPYLIQEALAPVS